MKRRFLILIAIPALLGSCSPAHSGHFRLPGELPEVSGLTLTGPDELWWLNDSGNGPFLFLTDRKGTLRSTMEITGSFNQDWEDLATDEEGHLYIGDFGNNRNDRRNLRIYIFTPSSGTLDSILFTFPDQRDFPPPPEWANFDMEAFFWDQDSLHLFSKNRLHKGNYYTKHYVLPDDPGQHTAVLRDSLFLKRRVVTAAAISPDRKRVALLTYWFKPIFSIIPLTPSTVFFLENFTGTDYLKGSRHPKRVPKCILPTQYEAADFVDERTLLIASEKTMLSRQKARMITREKPGKNVP